jgi:hypothetical protein
MPDVGGLWKETISFLLLLESAFIYVLKQVQWVLFLGIVTEYGALIFRHARGSSLVSKGGGVGN